uniref:Uncharacterized protein n=1 Tax=Podarcis muralis TaxID=64176 RepID=A0A670HMI4_PODMU
MNIVWLTMPFLFLFAGQTGFIETREACEAAEGWCQEGPCSIGPMEIGKCDTWIFCCTCSLVKTREWL